MKQDKTLAALFDFDGVVMDTETQYSFFWKEQGAKYCPNIPHFEHVIKGQTLDKIFEGYFKGMEDEKEQIIKELNRFESEMEYNYIPGVTQFMDELRKQGVKMAVVTSSSLAKMEKVYKTHPELPSLFDAIVTPNLFEHSKPHPECFLKGAQLLGAEPSDCFVFEDSFHGLQAGNAAQMTVIGLATTNPSSTIIDKAHLVIDNFLNFGYNDLMKIRG